MKMFVTQGLNNTLPYIRIGGCLAKELPFLEASYGYQAIRHNNKRGTATAILKDMCNGA